MEYSTEQKQAFLREQILEKYDPDEFISFMRDDLKMPDLDPDHLTMKQLASGVLKFKQYKYYQEMESPTRKTVVKARRTVELGGAGVEDDEFEARWECRALKSRRELKVTVPRFEKTDKDRFFFSSTEIWYVIESSLGGQIKRKESDFEWLAETIVRVFPLQAVPYLPSVRKGDEEDYDKRCKQFEEYLSFIARWPQVNSSKILEDFLSQTGGTWEQARKAHEVTQFKKGIRELKTESGWVQANFSNRIRSFVMNTTDYQSKMQKLYDRLGEGLSRVRSAYKDAAEETTNVMNTFAAMHECYSQLVSLSYKQNINQWKEVLLRGNKIFHVLSSNLTASTKIVESTLGNLHRQAIRGGNSVARVYRKVMEGQKQYASDKQSLFRKKEKTYAELSRHSGTKSMLSEWNSKEQAIQQLLPVQTQQLEQDLKWLGYLYSNYAHQFNKYISNQAQSLAKGLCCFGKDWLSKGQTLYQSIGELCQEITKQMTQQSDTA